LNIKTYTPFDNPLTSIAWLEKPVSLSVLVKTVLPVTSMIFNVVMPSVTTSTVKIAVDTEGLCQFGGDVRREGCPNVGEVSNLADVFVDPPQYFCRFRAFSSKNRQIVAKRTL
jgi:hypothetical protein